MPREQVSDSVDPAGVFDRLFVRARDADEFEYVSALLRIRGMEDAGWDPLEETQAIYVDIGSLMEAPLNDYARLRLGLLLYSHPTEVDVIYDILFNMVEVTARGRCVISPFHDLYRPKGKPRFEQVPPSAKRVVDRLKERALARDCGELAELLGWFFNDAVRNAFFHSDYVLHRDEFRSREGTFLDENNRPTASMKLPVIMELISRGLAFFYGFMTIYGEHRLAYRQDKIVKGRIGASDESVDVTLLADSEHGPYGFRG